MSFYIEINGVPNSPQRHELGSSGGTIGSGGNCQIQIAHSEVSDQALLLDIRGKDFWLQNLNPYSIYVGMEEVAPNAWSPWAVGETLQLTKSVALSIQELTVTEEGGELDEKGKKKTELDGAKIAQILLILACVIGAPLVLFTDKDEVGGVIDKRFDFNQIINDMKDDADKNIEYRAVRTYLQQAWMADRRFRKSRPAVARKAYQLLLHHRIVHENPDNREFINEIEDYASRRLAALGFGR